MELFTRTPDGKWILAVATSLDDYIEFSSVDYRLQLRDLYEGVTP